MPAEEGFLCQRGEVGSWSCSLFAGSPCVLRVLASTLLMDGLLGKGKQAFLRRVRLQRVHRLRDRDGATHSGHIVEILNMKQFGTVFDCHNMVLLVVTAVQMMFSEQEEKERL